MIHFAGSALEGGEGCWGLKGCPTGGFGNGDMPGGVAPGLGIAAGGIGAP